jgi:NTE family protein/lysophospholipid hydrolase
MATLDAATTVDRARLASLPLFEGLAADVLDELASGMESVSVRAGEVLVRAGDPGDAMFVVTEGAFHVEIGSGGSVHVVAHLGPGDPIGEIQLVLGGTRSATVIADTDSRALRLGRDTFDAIAAASPVAFEHLVEVVTRRLRQVDLRRLLPMLLGHLDDAVLDQLETYAEWVSLARGQALFHQGDASDAWYVVASGRLEVAIAPPGGAERVVREIGRGDSVGEMSIIIDDRRTASVYAQRDSELVRFSKAAFDELLVIHPRAMRSINKLLVKRLISLGQRRVARAEQTNIAIVGVGADAPVAMVARHLARHLDQHAPTLHVDARRLDELDVMHAAVSTREGHPAWLRFSGWLEEQSVRHRYVLLESDATASVWTKQAIEHSDQVVLVANASGSPALGEIEETILARSARRARCTLVLVHEDGRAPAEVERWLASRTLDRHVHVRASREADFGRLARLLTGRALGVALGGGGARGYAHVGVLRALEELGIAVDLVGGTSMGSVIAAMYAMGLSPDEIVAANREIIAMRPFTEYTLPVTSIVASERITRASRKVFGERKIEDLWLEYLCVSANLTTAQMVVHQRGLVWQATRASGSLPGILVPVLVDGNLLVDGGVMNNLPSDLVHDRGGGPVIAVDVSTEEDLSFRYPAIPSPWQVMWNRIWPFRRARLAAPDIATILMRTVMLASVNRTRANEASADLYLRPPIERYDMLGFHKLDELVEVGHRYALERVAAWQRTSAV